MFEHAGTFILSSWNQMTNAQQWVIALSPAMLAYIMAYGRENDAPTGD